MYGLCINHAEYCCQLECNETKPNTELSFGLEVDNKNNSCNTNDTLLKNNVYHTYMAGLDPIKN